MGDRSADTTSALVKALSIASFGLGLSELVAPGKVPAVAGVDDTPGRAGSSARWARGNAPTIASSRPPGWKPNGRMPFGKRR